MRRYGALKGSSGIRSGAGEPVWRISPRHGGGRSGTLSAPRDPWALVKDTNCIAMKPRGRAFRFVRWLPPVALALSVVKSSSSGCAAPGPPGPLGAARGVEQPQGWKAVEVFCKRLKGLNLEEGKHWHYIDAEDFSPKGGAELLDVVGIPFAPLPLLAVLNSKGERSLLRAGQELLQAGDTELRSWFDGSYSTPEKDTSYGLLLAPCPYPKSFNAAQLDLRSPSPISFRSLRCADATVGVGVAGELDEVTSALHDFSPFEEAASSDDEEDPICPTPYGKGLVDVCIGRETLLNYDVNEKYSPSLHSQLSHEQAITIWLIRTLSASDFEGMIEAMRQTVSERRFDSYTRYLATLGEQFGVFETGRRRDNLPRCMQGGGGTGAATIPESHFVIESSTSGEFSEHVTEAWNWQTIVGNVFFWENGRVVQVVRACDGKVLREIDTGQNFRRCFHRLANVKKKLFVCLNDCIKVWDYDSYKKPIELPPARTPHSLVRVGRPLELLVHRQRLILVESNCCLLWHTETLEFICCIQHDDTGAAFGCPVERPSPHADDVTGSQSHRPHSISQVQWMGDLLMTWGRGSLKSLNVWTLDGEAKAFLKTDSALVQVDVARVTWQSVYTLDHFILCALDSRSVVTFWDSKENFAAIFRFYCGCEEPFDLVLTQDFMVVINDNVSANRLDLCFWKLWLHPDFEAPNQSAESLDMTRSEARHQREARQGFKVGHRIPGIAGAEPRNRPPGPEASAAAAQLSGDMLQRFLHKELRPNCRPIKTLSIPDIDTYFASYRSDPQNLLLHQDLKPSPCHQESLSVYRSSSLQTKKAFFPPAKHTKFEEWLALQVHNDGTVVVHDFRPQQMAFDELLGSRCEKGSQADTGTPKQPAAEGLQNRVRCFQFGKPWNFP
ncbi:unnamed protein product [Cladocopium goreaui]|uniref:Proline dehydrogenase n=1 Tax=Cladocopium goreaui TaxID=2562237 RepID=A0A9P1GEQ9_9DINO|nr:unnamed protein product [Cladocopium goreaui]